MTNVIYFWRGGANLRQIRVIAPEATIIIFTGADNSVAERHARELGVTEFLKKGLALPTLVEIEAPARGSSNPVTGPSPGSASPKQQTETL